MHIIAIRPEPPGFGTTLARFDVELNANIRLTNLKLVAARNGGHRVYAPSAFQVPVATFSPKLAEELARAAAQAFLESKLDAHQSAA